MGQTQENSLYRRTFVGRDHELKHLQDAFDAAVLGNVGLTMVVGEPGIGQTALCEQAAASTLKAGADTAGGLLPRQFSRPG